MCIICCSPIGIPQPTHAQLRAMFDANPHGAGYMVARNGKVEISKGYMTFSEFSRAVRYEKFTDADAVVYHFRISTQAGVTPTMTHPFPLTRNIKDTKVLECSADVGVAHNGIIQLTTNPRDKEYSDTAHFVAEYLAYLIRNPEDLRDRTLGASIQKLIGWSRLAIMDGTGYIATLGNWVKERDGLLFSNETYRPRSYIPAGIPKNQYTIRGCFTRDDEPEDDEDDPADELLDDFDVDLDDLSDEEIEEIFGLTREEVLALKS